MAVRPRLAPNGPERPRTAPIGRSPFMRCFCVFLCEIEVTRPRRSADASGGCGVLREDDGDRGRRRSRPRWPDRDRLNFIGGGSGGYAITITYIPS